MKNLHKGILSTMMSVLIASTPVMALSSQESFAKDESVKQGVTSWVQSHKKSIGITGLAVTGVLAGLKIAATSALFCGIWNKELNHDFERHIGLECQDIKIGDLSGKSYKFLHPESKKLENKYVIFYGGNGCPVENLVPQLKTLLNKGATVVAVNYRGFGESNMSVSRFRISENTIYSDGENIYGYVRNKLNVKPENIIILGYSLGGSVASHVAARALYMHNDFLGGLILVSPITNVYDDASRVTCKPLGAIARVFTASSLDTVENLRLLGGYCGGIKPLYLCSGGPGDFLGLNNTKISKKICIDKFCFGGFKNVIVSVVSEAGHNDLGMILGSKIDEFVELINNPARK